MRDLIENIWSSSGSAPGQAFFSGHSSLYAVFLALSAMGYRRWKRSLGQET